MRHTRSPLHVFTAAIVGSATAALAVMSTSAAVQSYAHPEYSTFTAATSFGPFVAAPTTVACWTEPKQVGEDETICGSVELAPADAYGFTHDPYDPITGANRDRQDAAAAILDRMDSGLPIFEDWTWEGMPAVVGAYNDDLLDEYEATPDGDAEMFLIYASRGIHPEA